MADPYYSSAPSAGGEPDAFDVSMDALTVGVLRHSTDEHGVESWVLSSRGPLTFEDVAFDGEYDEERARSSASGWVENYVATERRDLLDDA